MSKSNRWIVWFFILVAFMIGLHLLDTYVLLQHGNNQSEMTYSSHHVAQDFTVCDGEERDVRLAGFYPKPMVVHFWASWDSASQQTLPVFQQLYLEYGDRIQFVMVNLTDGNKETMETAKEYLKENEYDFPVYYDIYGSAKSAYETRSIPATYFISSKFDLIARANGPVETDSLEQGMQMILNPEDDNEGA